MLLRRRRYHDSQGGVTGSSRRVSGRIGRPRRNGDRPRDRRARPPSVPSARRGALCTRLVSAARPRTRARRPRGCAAPRPGDCSSGRGRPAEVRHQHLDLRMRGAVGRSGTLEIGHVREISANAIHECRDRHGCRREQLSSRRPAGRARRASLDDTARCDDRRSVTGPGGVPRDCRNTQNESTTLSLS